MMRLPRFFRYRRNWLGLLLVGALVILYLLTPVLVPQDESASSASLRSVGLITDKIPHPPDENYLLGTLSGQYDVLYTLMWGLRQAFVFGVSVTLVTAIFGMVYGATSAYLGGQMNNTMMRIADAFLAFPVLAAVVFIIQLRAILLTESGAILYISNISNEWFFPEGLSFFLSLFFRADPVMWSLILLMWMPYARMVNANVLRLRNTEFIVSARALGAGHSRIILRHLLPNTISPVIVFAARDVGGMVILQATFTFIGIGTSSPWGQLLSSSRNWIIGPGGNPFVYWWTYLPATILLVLFGVSWNILGDSLNDWLNPRKFI